VEPGVKLARSLEAAHGWCVGQYAASVSRRRPESCAGIVPVNSGLCISTAAIGPFNFAVGIGLDGPVNNTELDEVEHFFRSRGMSPRVDVIPHAHESLGAILQERGYRISEITSVLAMSLEGELPSARTPDNVVLRWAEEHDCEDWVNILVKGFFVTDPGAERRDNLAALFCVPNSLNVIAKADGKTAGIAGGMIPDDLGVAVIFASSVLPQFRNRGIHGAMLRARLERAKNAGCKLVAVTATPGSTSERNLERYGFVPCYEKTTYLARE
jgi:GNAT superfamily N-acetyltransferase